MTNLKYVDYFENDWNAILATDSYKVSHQPLLPISLESLEIYGESRGGDYEHTVFAGFVPILRMLQGVQITKEKIAEAKWLTAYHFGTDQLFDEELWLYICEKYNGKLPIRIYAVPEGTMTKTSNVIFKTIPLEKRFADLASYVETVLMRVWYPIVIATNSGVAADVAKHYAEKTASEGFNWRFLLHDFGSRGVTTREQAQYGGAMHLLSFMGSDNFDGIRFLMKHYDNENYSKRFDGDYTLKTGFSVPATEHLVMTVEGRENEKSVYKRLLKMFTEHKLKTINFSLVSDTYNIFDVCQFVYDDVEIRELIRQREANTIFRPDSGNPYDVISKMLEIFSNTFGFHYNEKGYKVLNDRIRIIQGDGIDLTSYINLIRYFCDEYKWSIENFVFGSGGGLLQKFNRDTIEFAIKCSSATFKDGTEVDVYKDPITGSSKTSKKGKLWLFRIDGEDVTLNQKEMKERGLTIEDSLMKMVFDCGDVLINPTIEGVTELMQSERDRINSKYELENPQEHIDYNNDLLQKEISWLDMQSDINEECKNASDTRMFYLMNEIKRHESNLQTAN